MISIKDIASLINGELNGDPDFIIKGACNLQNGKKHHIAFLDSPKFTKFIDGTCASAIIIRNDYIIKDSNKIFIKVKNPRIAFAKVLEKFKNNEILEPKISDSSFIDKTAKLGKNIYIGNNVVIKKNVNIEDNVIIESGSVIFENCNIGYNTYIGPNVTLNYDTKIGSNVHIDAGCVLGADGFGWSTLDKKQIKIPQIGNVVINDDVWIGANCCIDRSTFESTIIGKGTKMDNLIQIGHNVIIGKNCLISGSTAIGGSTVIGDNVTIAGQVGIIDNLNIGDNSIIAAKSGVFKSFKSGSFISGIPAKNHNDRKRQEVLITKLPDLNKRIKNIENFLNNKDQIVD